MSYRAVLNVTAASDIFTQDLEDKDDDGGAPSRAHFSSGPSSQAQSAESTAPATATGEPEIPFAYETEEQTKLIKRIEAYPRPARVKIMMKNVLEVDPETPLHKLNERQLTMLAEHLEVTK